ETCPDLPVAGYRLRYWSILSQEDCRYVQMHHDIGLACREVTGKGPELLDDIWGPDSSSAVLKWLIPGNTYVFQVMAFNVSGEGDWSEASRPFIMPERPDGLGMESEEEEQVPEPPDEGVDPRLASMKGRPAHLSKSIDAIEIAWDKPCDRGSEIETYEFMISRCFSQSQPVLLNCLSFRSGAFAGHCRLRDFKVLGKGLEVLLRLHLLL
ncbi:unnamed protein product, partial [Symbiodinium sp. CCMP2456]